MGHLAQLGFVLVVSAGLGACSHDWDDLAGGSTGAAGGFGGGGPSSGATGGGASSAGSGGATSAGGAAGSGGVQNTGGTAVVGGAPSTTSTGGGPTNCERATNGCSNCTLCADIGPCDEESDACQDSCDEILECVEDFCGTLADSACVANCMNFSGPGAQQQFIDLVQCTVCEQCGNACAGLVTCPFGNG